MEAPRDRARTAVAAAGFVLAALVALAPHLWPHRPSPTVEDPDLAVAVTGAVAAPGTYLLPWGARVADAVEAAGGTAPDAAADLLAPARLLVDGERVHVPASRPADADPRISLNEASVHELERLPGVGPALAQRIVADRPYHRVEDLQRVRGIGPVTYQRLADRIRP